MASAGSMAVGCAALKDGVAPGNNPAAQVTEKVSNIRITALKFYWVGPAVYVKIETNRSVSGWGDIKGVDPRVAKPLAEAMRPALIGENPTRIEHIWQRIFRGHRNLRGGAFMVHALAGIDIALWDLAGKLYGQLRIGIVPGHEKNNVTRNLLAEFMLFARHTHDVGKDHGWERIGKGLNEINQVLIADCIEKVPHGRLHARPEGLDGLWRKCHLKKTP